MDTFENTAAALAALAPSAVPAAFDSRGHLFSPSSETAEYVDFRAGTDFGPLPVRPQGGAKAQASWFRTEASTQVEDFLGLRVGGEAQVRLPDETTVLTGTVTTTTRYGARVACPFHDGTLTVTVGRRDPKGVWS